MAHKSETVHTWTCDICAWTGDNEDDFFEMKVTWTWRKLKPPDMFDYGYNMLSDQTMIFHVCPTCQAYKTIKEVWEYVYKVLSENIAPGYELKILKAR